MLNVLVEEHERELREPGTERVEGGHQNGVHVLALLREAQRAELRYELAQLLRHQFAFTNRINCILFRCFEWGGGPKDVENWDSNWDSNCYERKCTIEFCKKS